MKFSVIAALTAALASFTVAMPIEDGEFAAMSEVDEAVHPLTRRTACISTDRANTADCKVLVNNLIAGGTNVLYAGSGAWSGVASHGRCFLLSRAGDVQGTSSYSRDVGYGARSIIDQCAHGGTVAGTNTAGGNGNFKLRMMYDEAIS